MRIVGECLKLPTVHALYLNGRVIMVEVHEARGVAVRLALIGDLFPEGNPIKRGVSKDSEVLAQVRRANAVRQVAGVKLHRE